MRRTDGLRRMDENRHISVTRTDQGPRAVVVPFQRSYFLRKKMHFYLLVAVIATTLLSWFNLNSWLIILLAACRLFDGRPVAAVRTAFSNQWFLAWFAVFALEVGGLFHTHDLYAAWKHVESKATLVAIPFIVCGGPFTDRDGYRRFCQVYTLLLGVLCLFCLSTALSAFVRTGDASVFFYHALTAALGSNAVFFSGYLLMALLFLLAGPFTGKGRSAQTARAALILFFTGMMVLLASKLMLVLLAVVLVLYLTVRYRVRVEPWRFVAAAIPLVLGILVLSLTSNPVRQRYSEVMRDQRNSISLRLFIWRCAGEILTEERAWTFGVTAGDSRDLLSQKYLAAGLSRGYIGYDCQNQYVEVLLRSGITGLCVFLAAAGLLIGLAHRKDTLECWIAVLAILLLAFTESTLEMQQPAFLSCFFPLFFIGKRRTPKNSA
ncbi:MAG TPA: O-antigen ligase family protein [Puia sp.]|nr:O-antigen ligase family protein [Puia sp.]